MKIGFTLLMISLIFARPAKGEAVKDFLLTCGYGTVAGALVGVASLAFSENPGEKSMNIARGASLGLYAGIIYGVSQLQRPAAPVRESAFWFEPMYHARKPEGLSAQWKVGNF